MQLFFEEDGTFKVGKILKQEGSAYQVELLSGKRTKVKGGHVFFEFADLPLSTFNDTVEKIRQELDPAFLWEAAPEAEFTFEDLAKDYFTTPSAYERVAMLSALHANPVYFYRKGRGQYKKAPADILKRALETLERRAREDEIRHAMARDMMEGRLPEAIANKALTLLIAPDKNSLEWKALNDAASGVHLTPLHLLLQLKAIRSAFAWHVDGFYTEHFPHGKNFPKTLPPPGVFPDNLAQANVRAFSIDDSMTTEIDDAASVTELPDGTIEIGIHIAAPAFLVQRDSPLDAIARERMSTVYAPGIKTTMLPADWIEATTLKEGEARPALSLYTKVNAETMQVLSTETRVERVPIVANLRYDKFEEEVTHEALVNGTLTIPFAHDIGVLYRFAKARLKEREERRGRPELPERDEWYFVLEGKDENARIALKKRVRGAPIDLVVSELMIYANTTWGLWLEEHNVSGIYRSQHMGRVKMGTAADAHDGLGVACYAWSTSPLRRYVDLINQRQILSAVLGMRPAYSANDTDLFTIVSSFESTYEIYNDFQRKMERYWSLRWIEQEGLKEIEAEVVRDDLVRIDGLPFLQRMPGLPELTGGARIKLAVIRCDFVDIVLEAKLSAVLTEGVQKTAMPL